MGLLDLDCVLMTIIQKRCMIKVKVHNFQESMSFGVKFKMICMIMKNKEFTSLTSKNVINNNSMKAQSLLNQDLNHLGLP